MVIWLPSSIFMLVITRAVMATSSCSLFTPEMYLNRFTNIWACSSYPSCCCSKVRKPSERRLPRPPPPRRPPLCTPISHLGKTWDAAKDPSSLWGEPVGLFRDHRDLPKNDFFSFSGESFAGVDFLLGGCNSSVQKIMLKKVNIEVWNWNWVDNNSLMENFGGYFYCTLS